MMNFIFLRHSIYEQPKNVPSALLPHPITKEGIEQAKNGASKIIEFFKGKEELLPKCIESSSLLRAYQTASIISEELSQAFNVDLRVVETDELVERKMGPMANLTVQQIEEVIAKDPRYPSPPAGWKSSKDYRLPYIGCESLGEAGERVSQYILHPDHELFADGRQNSDIYRLLVGHGASFRHACCNLGILNETDVPKLSMYYAEPLFFEFQNNTWKHISGDWKVRTKKDNID